MKIQLLLAAQLDSTHLGTSTHQEVDPRTAGAMLWEWAGGEGASASQSERASSGFAAPDTSRGVWRSCAQPDRVLQIMHGAHGETRMLAAGRFVATGFFTGDRFTGVLIPLNDSATTAVRGPRMLSGLLSGDASLTLSANADVPPDSPSAEGWILTEQTVSAFAARSDRAHRGNSRTNGLPQPDARLPVYGDYVFVEELPEAIKRVPPQYPDAPREAGVQGTVMVQVLVDTHGKVLDTRVVKSIPGLDEAATDAVKQWAFRPGMANGRPVACWLGVPVKFSLH
ncbi:MAG: energy transducer TonB [Candidatus Eisenbacteria bacterium]